MRKLTAASIAIALLISGCATKLEEPPPQEELLKDALPESTEIRVEWAAPAGDTGNVADGWLASFDDPQLDAIVAEALNEQNPNLRILAAQVDRANAAARLAGAALKPTVAMGAGYSGTAGPEQLDQQIGGAGVAVS